jgi:hypothetical protein
MKTPVFAFIFLSLAASAASAADRQSSSYVPCPRGYEGKCGDIPGLIAGATGAGEMICGEERMQTRRGQVADWSSRMHQIDNNLTQITGALRGLGNQYAAQGKMPLLAQTADFTANDLQRRLIHPLALDLAHKTQCYTQARRSSDGCYHTDCGDPATTVKNLESAQPSIDRVEADLENKRGALTDQLATTVTGGTPPHNRCDDQDAPFPCQSHMDRSVTQIVHAVQATSTLAGEIVGDAQ